MAWFMLSARGMAASAAGTWSSLNLGKTVGDDPENVEINHRRLAEALGVRRDDFTTTWQVHSHRVLEAAKEHRGTLIGQADGIVTNQVDLPLTQRFGDCTPILVYDPSHHAVGLAHAGWRGTVAGMASSLVQAMVAHYGSDPAELAAVVGPAIGPCCYEVGDEVVDAVRHAFPDIAPVLERLAAQVLKVTRASRLANTILGRMATLRGCTLTFGRPIVGNWPRPASGRSRWPACVRAAGETCSSHTAATTAEPGALALW